MLDTRNEMRLAPRKGWRFPPLSELVDRRDLLFVLAGRDIRVRYRQTFFGAAWAVLPSIATVAVFTAVFGTFLRVPSYGVPYWAFSLCAMVPWNFFTQAVTAASNSVVLNASLVEKVYFPRALLPLGAILAHVVDLCIGIAVLVAALAIGGVTLSAQLLAFIPLSVIAIAVAIGFGLCLGALNVIYRDVRHIVPVMLQLYLFATPVVYASTSVPEPLRFLLALNPMSGVVEGFRWAFLGVAPPNAWLLLASSSVTAAVALLAGALVFGTLDRRFADVI